MDLEFCSGLFVSSCKNILSIIINSSQLSMDKHFHAYFLCPWTTFHAGLNFPWKLLCFPWTTLSMSMDNNILVHGQCPWNLDFHGKTSLFHGIPCFVHGNPCIFHGKLRGSMEDLQPGFSHTAMSVTDRYYRSLHIFRNLSLRLMGVSVFHLLVPILQLHDWSMFC